MSEAQHIFYHLSVALAIGLMIGIERGWEGREAGEGRRVAGVRTYGLIGLLGGGTALIAQHVGALVLGFGFIGMVGALTAVYVINLRHGTLHHGTADVGITSLIAGLLTFVLGALAVLGEVAVAAAFAVVTTLLLAYKPQLHRWVSGLEANELRAGIRLLLISVVLLPVLPNKGYGPWHVLNPYAIWWMVVLIAIISFVGYFAIKIAGAQRGAVFTGLFGGLASSTAVTLHFSRMSRRNTALTSAMAMGILLACGTMFPRMVLVASVINPGLFKSLWVPAIVMAVLVYIPALVYWRLESHRATEAASTLKNPLELKAALSFGLLLVVVMLLSKALQIWLGEIGVFVLSAASGVADVDAITLSLARMSHVDLHLPIAVTGIVIAAAVNSMVKAGMAIFIGGRQIGIRVGLPLMASAFAGILSVWFWVW
jgi:uncharacterized membrane protein (DUF4010 family)